MSRSNIADSSLEHCNPGAGGSSATGPVGTQSPLCVNSNDLRRSPQAFLGSLGDYCDRPPGANESPYCRFCRVKGDREVCASCLRKLHCITCGYGFGTVGFNANMFVVETYICLNCKYDNNSLSEGKDPLLVEGKVAVDALMAAADVCINRWKGVKLELYDNDTIGQAVDGPKLASHPHPNFHFGRRYWTEYMYRKLSRGNTVVDVGGRLKQHKGFKRVVHSLEPHILATDVACKKETKTIVQNGLTFCEHKIQDCRCVSAPDGYMLIHSLYYLTPEQIYSMLLRGPVMALHHVFEGAYGVFEGGEANYYLEYTTDVQKFPVGQHQLTDYHVVMHVKGQREIYNHNDLSWIYKDNLVGPSLHLVANTMLVGNMTAITTFDVVATPISYPPLATYPMAFVNDNDFKAPIETVQAKVVPYTLRQNWYCHLNAFVSESAVTSCVGFISGKQRTPETLLSLQAHSKRIHRNFVGVPGFMLESSIWLSPIIAFVKTVQQETKAMVVVQNAKHHIASHNRVFDMQATWFEWLLGKVEATWWEYFWNRRWVLGAICAVTGSYLYGRWQRKAPTSMNAFQQVVTVQPAWALHVVMLPLAEEIVKRAPVGHGSKLIISAALGVADNLGTPVSVGQMVVSIVKHYLCAKVPLSLGVLMHSTNNYINWQLNHPGFELSSKVVCSPCEALTKPMSSVLLVQRIYNAFRTSLDVKGVQHGSMKLVKTCVPGPDVSFPVKNIESVFLDVEGVSYFLQNGGVFTKKMPIVHSPCVSNEAAALHYRLHNNPVQPKPKPLKQFVSFALRYYRLVLTHEKPLVYCPMDHYCGGHYEAFKLWNTVDRFGKTRVQDQWKAFMEVLSGWVSGFANRDLFVKQEKKAGAEEDFYDGDDQHPRHIQGATPKLNCKLGPWFFAYNKFLKENLNNAAFCYANGLTPQQTYTMLPHAATYYVGDVSRFDRSICEDILQVMCELRELHHCCSRMVCKAWRSQTKTRGYTKRGGLFYSVSGQRKSGDANTSCDNSIINLFLHMFAVMQQLNLTFNQLQADYSFLVLGDDIVVSGPTALQRVDFKMVLLDLGFVAKPKFVHDRWHVEFCSRYFWPSNLGGTLSVKAGRFFSRCGYVASAHCPATFAEICSGQYYNNSVVPFVRIYLKRFANCKPYFEKGIQYNQQYHHPTVETWAMFFELYGLTPHDEEQFEKFLGAWDGGPALLSHPYVSHLMAIDA
jgi:hypothetical protein